MSLIPNKGAAAYAVQNTLRNAPENTAAFKARAAAQASILQAAAAKAAFQLAPAYQAESVIQAAAAPAAAPAADNFQVGNFKIPKQAALLGVFALGAYLFLR
jgi:hypothetical protein